MQPDDVAEPATAAHQPVKGRKHKTDAHTKQAPAKPNTNEWSSDEDEKPLDSGNKEGYGNDLISDQLLSQLVIVTQTPPTAKRQYDRTGIDTMHKLILLLLLGDHVPRSRTNSLMVREIDDGLRRYEMDLWTLDPTQAVNKVCCWIHTHTHTSTLTGGHCVTGRV
jgi:hypothetical protein